MSASADATMIDSPGRSLPGLPRITAGRVGLFLFILLAGPCLLALPISVKEEDSVQ